MRRQPDRQLLGRSRGCQPPIDAIGNRKPAIGQSSQPAQLRPDAGFAGVCRPAAARRLRNAGGELLGPVIGAHSASAHRANPVGNRSGRPRGHPAQPAQRPRPDRERTVGGENRADRPRPQRCVPSGQDRSRAHAVPPTALATPSPPRSIAQPALRLSPAPRAGRPAQPPGLFKKRDSRRLFPKGAARVLDRNRIGIAQRQGRHCNNLTHEQRHICAANRRSCHQDVREWSWGPPKHWAFRQSTRGFGRPGTPLFLESVRSI